MKENLKAYSLTNCGKSQEIFTKHLSREISSLNNSSKNFFHISFIFNNNYHFIEQTYILLKSILLFSSNQTKQIHLHIIINDLNARNYFSQQV